MEKEFVPYELALQLKELGFDQECFGWWSYINGTTASFYGYHCTNSELIELNSFNKNCTAPLWQQAFKFILTKLDLEIDYNTKYELNFDGEFNLYKLTWIDYEGYSSEFDTGGNENCLKELIKIVKKKS